MDMLDADAGRTEPDTEDTGGLFLTIKQWVTADIEHSAEWRTRAKANFAFVAGPGQWDAADIQKLKDEKRPIVTFNKTLKFVRAICGLEVNNRQMTTFLPRDVTNVGEVKANEVLSNASDWMSQGCKADRQQSRAFRDVVICGMGWTEGALDYDDDPKGKYIETRVNPLEMGWDCSARDNNLQDAKRRWRLREMTLREAKALIPGVTDEDGLFASDLDAAWAGSFGQETKDDTKTQEQKELREENVTVDSPLTKVKLLQIQWWEYETYHLTVDPATGQQAEMSAAEFKIVNMQYQEATGVPLPSATLRRKVYKQAFVGGKVLQVGPGPRRDGFTFQCMTGEPDDNEGVWFGMVDVLRDPQVWANKFFAQLMHIINTTAKGGIIAEEDAFADIRQAQSSYAKTDHITIAAKGALTKGKIIPKPGAALSGGILQLLQISDAMFAETTGMNMELMGLADRQQPGVLEAQRKQAAMTILATLFDALSSFREDVGRMRLTFIQDYLADDRLIRIHGDDGHEAMPLIRDKVLGTYDVIVDDAPSSTNMKEKAWASLSMLLPTIRDMLTPEVVVMLLDYVPGLPSRLVQTLKEIASKPPKPEVIAMQQRAQTAEVEKIEAAALKSKTGAVLDLAKAAAERAQMQTARIQAVDAQLAEAGLIDPMGDVIAPTNVTPLSRPVAPPMAPEQQPMPLGPPDLALPGGLV